MARQIDNADINYIQDGENLEKDVLNRPTEELTSETNQALQGVDQDIQDSQAESLALIIALG